MTIIGRELHRLLRKRAPNGSLFLITLRRSFCGPLLNPEIYRKPTPGRSSSTMALLDHSPAAPQPQASAGTYPPPSASTRQPLPDTTTALPAPPHRREAD